MKYYHLVGLSGGVLLIQFLLQNVFQLSLPRVVKGVFFALQAFLFISYSVFLLVYRVNVRQKKRQLKRKNNIVPLKSEEQETVSILKAS
ncbi:hypothetical protein IV487_05295 [Enterococcus saccharolyticus]|uniref:Uncharacterized protein n=1 Tax=Candidatus Enterococcus willemsii TaxID=1857215 RepID=A0ABQ6YWR8_9ENTE|nr:MULTISPECIES: hypothetical protein [Enterococcus]KAF1302133.1 hypothetical protein BAU17_01805 [Enterococcus sp. CU12B]MCD5001888.1 hypothetical protein [Enterococcus saccharolyticus]